MDGIQPYSSQSRPPAHAHPHPQAYHAPINPAAVKAPSDYFRAVRRRFWLVLMVAVPLSVAATVHAVRQPSVYRAEAQIQIVPPQYDQVLSTLVSHELGRSNKDADLTYLPNKVNQLKSVYLLERVLSSPDFLNASNPGDTDAAKELLLLFQVKPLLNSNHVYVSLEGTDPTRTAKLLFAILDQFKVDAKSEADKGIESSKDTADLSLQLLQNERTEVDKKINEMLNKSEFIGPGGKNLIQAQLDSMGTVLLNKRFRFDDFRQQSWIAKMNPRPATFGPEENARSSQIARLQEERQKLHLKLIQARRASRSPSDPTIVHFSKQIGGIMDQIEQLERSRQEMEPPFNPFEEIASEMNGELERTEKATQELIGKLRDSMPDHQKYLSYEEEREAILKRIYDMQTKLSEFKTLAASQREPVTIPPFIAEPTIPVRPRRSINIAAGLILSFGLGIGLVCLFEYLDHSVKVPEHLTIGLTLPLLGVVPRIRRTSPRRPRRSPLDPRSARFARSRRLPKPPSQPFRRVRPPRPDRDLARHQRQGRRRQEHHRAESRGDLRPSGRANPLDGCRPTTTEPRRRLPAGPRNQARIGRRPPGRTPLATDARSDRHPQPRLSADRRYPRGADRDPRNP